jgi:hypothetical protein
MNTVFGLSAVLEHTLSYALWRRLPGLELHLRCMAGIAPVWACVGLMGVG